MEKVLVTGGAGFIGSNFIRMLLKENSNLHVCNLDALTYSANLENLTDIQSSKNYSFHKKDIVKDTLKDLGDDFDYIYHFAAESHVDRSILGAQVFVETNVMGTFKVLEFAKLQKNLKKFIHVSTDEVYGTLSESDPSFTEETSLAPNSPYSASKAGSDCLVRSYFHTYHLPTVITRCGNNYGPFQFPEKLIPLMIIHAMEDKPLPVYGDGKNIRDWIHVEDHCAGILLAGLKGKVGEVYNIGADNEQRNLTIVKKILKLLNKPESLIKFVTDRPGHDWRYSLNCTKIKNELGFKLKYSWDQGFESTVGWYQKNANWWKKILNKEYLNYYQTQYGNRL